MAHTFSNNTRFTGNTDDLTQAFTCASGVTVLVLAIVVGGTTAREAVAPTYNGIDMVQSGSVRTSAETNCELWFMVNPLTGSSYNIVVPNSGTLNLYCQASCYKAQSGYTTVYDKNAGGVDLVGSTNPRISVTPTNAASLVVGTIGGDYDLPASNETGINLNRTDDGAYWDGNQYYLNQAASAFDVRWNYVLSQKWCINAAVFYETKLAVKGCVCDDACHVFSCTCDTSKYVTSCTCQVGACYGYSSGSCTKADYASGCTCECYGYTCSCESAYQRACRCESNYAPRVWMFY